jgi:VEFS-Box of polycomb protein
MLYASDRKFSNSFIGDFTFDLERERTRYSLFLHRNIMRVLDHHARRCRRATRSLAGTSQIGVSTRTSQEKLVTPPPRSTRLRDQLVEKFHQQDAELIFNVSSIRRKLNYRENLNEQPRKRVKREAVECRCYLAVWDNRQGHRQLEPILKRSEDCIVTPADTASDAHAAVVELEGPFRIPAREFFVPILDKGGHVSKWAIGDNYLLEIKIIPCNTSELWPPIPILSKSEDSLMRGFVKRNDLAFTGGILISNYTNLPHAPSQGVPLNISFDQGGRTFKTKYGLEVNAEWTYPHVYDAKLKKEEDSIAGLWEDEEKKDPLCRSIDTRRNAKARKPRLKESELDPPSKPSVKVSYVWDTETKNLVSHEFRTMTIEGLYCPVCHIQESTSLKRLQFHFCNTHDKYKFTIESEGYDLENKTLERVIFRVEVADIVRPRAVNHAKDEREFSWQRPKRPFDIDAYVSGEQAWVGALPRRRTAATAAAAQAQQARVPVPTTFTQIVVGAWKNIFRPSAEVSEVPLPVRKKFQVPKAKTRKKTSFYRSINHRVTETGEMLSETDDEIDDAWLIKRHHDTIDETEGLTGAEKEFRQRWNGHIISEGCFSSRYISDSLVRFVRKNAAWLRGSDHEPDMFIQFQDLTAKLMERGVVDSGILNDCLRMIRDAVESVGERTAATNQDASGLSPNAATAAVNDSISMKEPDLGEDIAEGSGETRITDDEKGKTSEAANRETSTRMDHIQHLEWKADTITAIPTHDSHSRPSASIPQSITSKLQLQPSPANGFCGTCNNFIDRPKRNAITCSYSVSPLPPFLDFVPAHKSTSSPVLHTHG